MLRYFQLISGYFYGKAKRTSKKCAYKTRNWTYLDVVSVKKRQKINKLSEKLSESAPGSRAFLGTWSKARHQVELTLTDPQRQEYKALAKKWSENKLPQRMQTRYVHGNNSSR